MALARGLPWVLAAFLTLAAGTRSVLAEDDSAPPIEVPLEDNTKETTFVDPLLAGEPPCADDPTENPPAVEAALRHPEPIPAPSEETGAEADWAREAPAVAEQPPGRPAAEGVAARPEPAVVPNPPASEEPPALPDAPAVEAQPSSPELAEVLPPRRPELSQPVRLPKPLPQPKAEAAREPETALYLPLDDGPPAEMLEITPEMLRDMARTKEEHGAPETPAEPETREEPPETAAKTEPPPDVAAKPEKPLEPDASQPAAEPPAQEEGKQPIPPAAVSEVPATEAMPTGEEAKVPPAEGAPGKPEESSRETALHAGVPEKKELPPDTLTPIRSPAEGEEGPRPPDDGEPPRPPLVAPSETPREVAVGDRPQVDLSGVQVQPVEAEVAPDARAEFELRGPEAWLGEALGQFVLKDEYERELDRGTLKLAEVPKTAEGVRRFAVRISNAIGSEHLLTLSLTGPDDRRLERASAIRIRRRVSWDAWVALLHAPYPGGHWRTLERMGVRGGMAYRLHAERHAELKMAGAAFYVENVARQFLSRYHSERGLWEKTLDALANDPDQRAALAREPSLCSPEFERAFAAELERHAQYYRGEHPLFYSLAAEPSVTRLSAACDFDFHPQALAEFRRWLERDVYGTLKTLNEYWGTDFATWDEVVPMTTGEARLRLRDRVMNFAPWCDFRAFNDHVFAKVLRNGGELLRRHDPEARAGITGAMGAFAFGGWDWSNLAGALDVVEAYDLGGARPLWRDLAPGKPALAMVPLGAKDKSLRDARRTLWTLALDGSRRGALLWDESYDAAGSAMRVLLDPEGQPTDAAAILAPTLRELDGPLGLLLSRLERERGAVGLLYSPESVRLNWLFEADALHGEKWLAAWGADTSAERRESPQYRLRESWMKLLADLGLPWRFVSSEQVARGELKRGELQALVLPRAIALGDAEAGEIRAFAEAGGIVVADAAPAQYDSHGHRRRIPALDRLFGVNTVREPPLPEAPRPLERVEQIGAGDGPAPLLSDDLARVLPPPYSDKPLWLDEPPPRRCEYRRAPALAVTPVGKGVAVYLNLNLQDYYRWRLHADEPRARGAREALKRYAFAPLLASQPVNLEASQLPEGTELIWYTLPNQAEGEHEAPPVRVLALRRNIQERLHELGNAADTNQGFEQPERFKLVLRQELWLSNLLSDLPAAKTAVIEGTLDPVTPKLFALRERVSPAPAVLAPVDIKLGERLEVTVMPGPGADHGPRVYGLRVLDPEGAERPHYGGKWVAPNGKMALHVPLAVNDPCGDWTFLVRDATTGLESKIAVKVTEK